MAGWLLTLIAVTGTVLGLDRWTDVVVADWLLVLTELVFAVAIAALVIAGFMAFVIWWFFSRNPR